MNKTENNLLTPAQAAKILNVSTTTLRQWAQVGKIKFASTLGGHRRFEESYIMELAKTSKTKPAAKNILIIDDDELFASMLIDFFEINFPDIQVSVALSGFDAGEMVHRLKPELIILDLMMPGIDGFAVCLHLKSIPESRHIPVIAVTGDHSQENNDKIISAGAECCFGKPMDIRNLNEVVTKLLKL